MKDLVQITYWDTMTNSEVETVASLDDIIRNPSGYKMEQVGFYLLNRERRLMGLPQYKRNLETGTYDQMTDAENEEQLVAEGKRSGAV